MGRPRESLEDLHRRAVKHARIAGRAFGLPREDAEDFGAWYAIHVLEGKGKKQTITQAYVDYLRVQFGRLRGANDRYNFNRAMRKALAATPADFGGSMDESLDRQVTDAGLTAGENPEEILLRAEAEEAAAEPLRIRFLRTRQNEILDHLLAGKSIPEIAAELGLSDCRVYGLFNQMRREIASRYPDRCIGLVLPKYRLATKTREP